MALVHFAELSAPDERHNKVDTDVILKQVVHRRDEGMLTVQQDLLFECNIFNLILLKQAVLSNCLDRILCLLITN